ncbi:MAG TPA: MFS transporter, partial [Acidimicrobiales bacterium]
LIADWWPVEQRARRISIFNTLSAVGVFAGLIIAGVLVDQGAWRFAFVIWLPVALLGAALINSRPEPHRGGQDVLYRDRLESERVGTEHDHVVDLVEHGAVPQAVADESEHTPGGFLADRLLERGVFLGQGSSRCRWARRSP